MRRATRSPCTERKTGVLCHEILPRILRAQKQCPGHGRRGPTAALHGATRQVGMDNISTTGPSICITGPALKPGVDESPQGGPAPSSLGWSRGSVCWALDPLCLLLRLGSRGASCSSRVFEPPSLRAPSSTSSGWRNFQETLHARRHNAARPQLCAIANGQQSRRLGSHNHPPPALCRPAAKHGQPNGDRGQNQRQARDHARKGHYAISLLVHASRLNKYRRTPNNMPSVQGVRRAMTKNLSREGIRWGKNYPIENQANRSHDHGTKAPFSYRHGHSPSRATPDAPVRPPILQRHSACLPALPAALPSLVALKTLSRSRQNLLVRDLRAPRPGVPKGLANVAWDSDCDTIFLFIITATRQVWEKSSDCVIAACQVPVTRCFFPCTLHHGF